MLGRRSRARAHKPELTDERAVAGQAWLQKIFDLTQLLNRSDSTGVSLDLIIENVRRSLNVDRVSVLLFDTEGVMRFKVSRGLSLEYRQAVEGHSPWPAGVKDPQAILVPDALNDTTLSQFHKVILSEGIHALGFIPIVYRETLLGKFMIYYDSPHIFTEEELLYCQTAASMVAFALHREQTEQELRSREALVAGLGNYITQIATNLYFLYGVAQERISLRIDCNPEYVDPDRAATCGLIVNEILSNSLRHAFPMDRNGTIYIHFLRRDDDYLLQIGDDGIGLPQEIDFDSQITLGLRLVLTLVSQLNGTVRIDRSQGTVFQIEFP